MCVVQYYVCIAVYSQHYESHAFVRDEDVVGPLQQLLAGLSQINFNM